MKFTSLPFLLILLFSLNSCKSSEKVHLSEPSFIVSEDDFKYLDNTKYENVKAIILNESLDFRIEGIPRTIWKKYEEQPSDIWVTTIEDKILFLSDNSTNDAFTRIDYPYPKDVRWDLMRKCEMWLYSRDDRDNIQNRKLRKSEFVNVRLNDSIGSVQLRIKEPIKGKILVRKYSVIYPYYKQYQNKDNWFTKIIPFIIQREIPLLFGSYHFILPELASNHYEMKQFGEGELDIQQTNSVELHLSYTTFPDNSSLKGGRHTQMSTKSYVKEYKAEKIIVNVSDIPALPERNNAQPLGIEITRVKDK